MKSDTKKELLSLLEQFKSLEIAEQIDFDKFYLYSIITHSTAIEGSTVTEVENMLMFDEGILPSKRTVTEQMMNLDLKNAYEKAFVYAGNKADITVPVLIDLASSVMKNTGSSYKTLRGEFDSAKGDLRLVNVSAGRGGKSYLAFTKVPDRLNDFCQWLNNERHMQDINDAAAIYEMSFEAHYRIVTIHPWVDGNGRMARLLMNEIQYEYGLLPGIVYKEDKNKYIETLAEAQEVNDSSGFIEFMSRELIKFLGNCISDYKKSTGQETTQKRTTQKRTTQKRTTQKRTTQKRTTQKKTTQKRTTQKKIMDSSEKIVKKMIENPKITRKELALELGLSEDGIKWQIGKLKKDGIIMREGGRKNGNWVVSDNKLSLSEEEMLSN